MAWITAITDRTQLNVDNSKAIRAEKLSQGIDFDDLDADEKIDITKGCIYDETINRIENNQAYLKEKLNEAGYWRIPFTNKTDWDWETDILFVEDWETIINNLNILKSAYFVYNDTPQIPDTRLDYINLNAVEKILDDINSIYNSMVSEYRFCGTFNCGE